MSTDVTPPPDDPALVAIWNGLVADRHVRTQLGLFVARCYKPYRGTNPRTKEPVFVQPKPLVLFIPSKELAAAAETDPPLHSRDEDDEGADEAKDVLVVDCPAWLEPLAMQLRERPVRDIELEDDDCCGYPIWKPPIGDVPFGSLGAFGRFRWFDEVFSAEEDDAEIARQYRVGIQFSPNPALLDAIVKARGYDV